MALQVLTANRLSDGAVVYLGPAGKWSDRIADAQVAADQQAGERLLADGERAVADRIVVAPYLIDVTADRDAVVPVRFREAIRAEGPTVPSDFRPSAEDAR